MRVGVVATGGTIAARRDQRGDLVPEVTGSDLLSAVSVDPRLELEFVDLEPAPSFATTLQEMVTVVQHVSDALARGCAGVLVTHGTDSLEEMAFLTAMLLPLDAPVVLTGAQRPADDQDTDATRNLTDSLAAVAARLPVCVVMGGLAIAGAEARKIHTSEVGAFSGGAAGALALIDDGEVVRLSSPCRGGSYAHVPAGDLPRVDVVKVGVGTDDTHIDASVSAGAAGIVLEALGRGNVGGTLVEAVERAVAKDVPVLVTSRVGAGLVRPAYGRGGGSDLARVGADFAGDLTSSRARVALALALAHPELGSVSDQVKRVWKGAC